MLHVMIYQLSHHAAQRMAERDVTEDELQQALHDQESQWPGKRPDTIVVIGRTRGGRRLKIVIALDDDDPLIVTVVPIAQ